MIGSWAPFQWQSAETATVWRQFIRHGFAGYLSRSDIVVNFWLGFPLVLGLSGLVRSHAGSLPRRLFWILGILGIQAGLSLSVELGQGWFAYRIPSVADVAFQLAGAVLASLLWQWCGRWIEAQVNLAYQADALMWTRLDAVLTLIAVGIMAWTLMPFDLIVSPIELARESLKTEFVPFTRLQSTFSENLYQWTASCFLAIPLGLWGSRWLATRFQGKVSIPTVFLMAIATGLLPEVCQFPIDSRVASATDALFGILGAFVGLLLGSQFQSTRFQLAKASFREMAMTPGFWFALAMLQGLAICVIAWMPYDFTSEPSLVANRMKRFLSEPFSGYRGSDLLNVLTLFRQAMLAAFLGGFLGLAHHFLRWSPLYSIVSLTLTVFIAFVFLAGVELGQLAVESRTGEGIGFLTRSSGALLGLVVAVTLSKPSKLRLNERKAAS